MTRQNRTLFICLMSWCGFYCSMSHAKAQFWQCTVVDSQKKQWVVEHPYRLPALNHAMESCKRQSQDPGSCKNSSLGCDLYINGHSTRPLWQCTALDRMGTPWRNIGSRDKYDAAFEARDRCKKLSHSPDTCYINLIACKNLNATE